MSAKVLDFVTYRAAHPCPSAVEPEVLREGRRAGSRVGRFREADFVDPAAASVGGVE